MSLRPTPRPMHSRASPAIGPALGQPAQDRLAGKDELHVVVLTTLRIEGSGVKAGDILLFAITTSTRSRH